MTLSELKKAVDSTVEGLVEYGVCPDNVRVGMQIDGPETESVWAKDDIELLFDNDGQVSGCVLLGEFSGREA